MNETTTRETTTRDRRDMIDIAAKTKEDEGRLDDIDGWMCIV